MKAKTKRPDKGNKLVRVTVRITDMEYAAIAKLSRHSNFGTVAGFFRAAAMVLAEDYKMQLQAWMPRSDGAEEEYEEAE